MTCKLFLFKAEASALLLLAFTAKSFNSREKISLCAAMMKDAKNSGPVLVSRSQKIWAFGFSVSRKIKSEPAVFSLSQEICECGIYAGPENLDHLYFHVPRKSGVW
jgi:hypothetical protein